MNAPGGAQRKKTTAPDDVLERLVHDRSPEALVAAASHARLTEDLALALLNRRDLPAKALEALHKNGALVKHKKVRLAIVTHPRTPRHISIPIIRHLYPFELMQVALFPAVAADVKRMAEEAIIGKLGLISSGERYTLAKQSSGRIAAALLLDAEERIMLAALDNPQMTEVSIAKALRAQEGTEMLVAAVCSHRNWSSRLEIKTALLINKHTPPARVVEVAAELPISVIKEVLYSPQLQAKVKSYLKSVVEKRAASLQSRT
jgi:hypothetical protein